MKNLRLLTIFLGMVSFSICQAQESEKERAARQAELDAACEFARQEKLALVRAQYVEECVENEERSDRAACERFYADYGENSANQAPLFYDLPQCETAYEYKRSYRSSAN